MGKRKQTLRERTQWVALCGLLVALMLGFMLPPPFIIPLYADVTGHGEYISTTLSISTLLSVAAFIGIAAYTLA